MTWRFEPVPIFDSQRNHSWLASNRDQASRSGHKAGSACCTAPGLQDGLSSLDSGRRLSYGSFGERSDRKRLSQRVSPCTGSMGHDDKPSELGKGGCGRERNMQWRRAPTTSRPIRVRRRSRNMVRAALRLRAASSRPASEAIATHDCAR